VAALLEAADDFRVAQDIRACVAALGLRPADVSEAEGEGNTRFASWALAEADRLDPSLKSTFIGPDDVVDILEDGEEVAHPAPIREAPQVRGYWPRPWWARRR
jgi:hypothetical protein